jgi:hypothetical protein
MPGVVAIAADRRWRVRWKLKNTGPSFSGDRELEAPHHISPTDDLDLIRIGGQVNWRGVRVSFFFLIHQDDGCGRSWETAFCAVFQIPVGAFLASTGMAASMPYAAASRSNLAGLI